MNKLDVAMKSQRLHQSTTTAGMMVLAALIAMFWGSFQAKTVSAELDATNPEPLCRFGVNHNISLGELTSVDIEPLRAGFFLDYTAVPSSKPATMQHFRMVRLKQPDRNSTNYEASPPADNIRAIAEANPGSVWLIGNEVDRTWYQDDMMPDAYARAYHELYELLRQADPTARIVAGNIVQVSPLRLAYLDKVLAAYKLSYGQPMPIDIWGIHAFILREKKGQWGAEIPPGIDATEGWLLEPEQNDDFELFRQQIIDFRRWMYRNGYRDRPLYLTEYGVLIGDPWIKSQDVINFMSRSFDYLLNARDTVTGYPADGNRMVQNFAWYSVNDKLRPDANGRLIGFNGYLFDPENNNQRTDMGDAYAGYTAQISMQTDLLPVQIKIEPASLISTTEPVTLTINVQVANAGNTPGNQEFKLRIYNGDPDNGGILLDGAELSGALPGCGQSQWFSYTWTDVPSGVYALYADVTANGSDIDPSNDRIYQTVLFATNQVLLPMTAFQLP